MRKLVAVATHRILLGAALLALPAIAAAQAAGLKVELFQIRDERANERTSFAPGELVGFHALLRNSTGRILPSVEIRLTSSIYNHSQYANINPGVFGATWQAHAPAPSQPGNYTATISVIHRNSRLSASRSAIFTVRARPATRPSAVPRAPSDLRLDIVSDDAGIGVSWRDNSNNEQGFNIFNAFENIRVQANQTFLSSDWGLRFDRNGRLSPGQCMCFQVSAYNAAGSSAPTPRRCITTPAVGRSPPRQICQNYSPPADVLSLKLNFDKDPTKSASAELRAAARANPVVEELVMMAQCAIDLLPYIGKTLKLSKRTIEVLDRVEKIEGRATLITAVVRDIRTNDVMIRSLFVVGDVLNYAIPGTECIVLVGDLFFAPPLPSTISAPITPIPVPTPTPPRG